MATNQTDPMAVAVRELIFAAEQTVNQADDGRLGRDYDPNPLATAIERAKVAMEEWPEAPPVMTTSEVAEILGLHRNTVLYLANKYGYGRKFGKVRGLLFTQADLEALKRRPGPGSPGKATRHDAK